MSADLEVRTGGMGLKLRFCFNTDPTRAEQSPIALLSLVFYYIIVENHRLTFPLGRVIIDQAPTSCHLTPLT